ncbi:MAG: sensor histidine kinase [Candidatus Sericytochromatia bacterium]|nr:sensor histidine kinase [Candidatus Sericytochromatia bacterium]
MPGYFRSILQNLIDNAVKYQAPERSLELHIRVSRPASDRLALQVQDNGQGLPPPPPPVWPKTNCLKPFSVFITSRMAKALVYIWSKPWLKKWGLG